MVVEMAQERAQQGVLFERCWYSGPITNLLKSPVHSTTVDCVWNVMAHAQKPDFDFRSKRTFPFNLLTPELFFLILAHPEYKMCIIQVPNMLELWNKLHFEEEETETIY